ncbi:MAG: 6,7-dimethyl-8-ribityllumazine synthase [Pirellulales bacterium]
MTTSRASTTARERGQLPAGSVALDGGDRLPVGARVAVVVSRYNDAITEAMLAGAVATLTTAGLAPGNLTVARVPGAFELPLAADRLAESGRHDAVICLGAIIRGETTHDQHIAAAVSLGIEAASRQHGVPITFGVLTCGTIEQAIARAGGIPGTPAPGLSGTPAPGLSGTPAPGNKGSEAAAAAVAMVVLLRQIAAQGT